MDDSSLQSDLEQEPTLSRPRALRDILIVGSPIFVLGIVGNVVGLGTLAGGAIVSLGYVLMIVFGAILLKNQSSSWREVGLRKPVSWLTTAIFGVGAFVAAAVVFVAMQDIAIGVLTALGQAPPEIDLSRFNAIEGNLPFFILMVILAWTTIAFGEEMFYRAFLITRMIDFTTIGRGLAVLIAGIIFGVVHFAEGPVGILSNGAFGLLFGWIYVRSGRNLWITIIGHGLINSLRFTLLYAGAA
jgi:membrane protease YdiL (CAAX protease family)